MESGSQNMSRSVMPLQFSNPESSLKLAESKSIIDRFFFDLCGLQVVRQGDKENVVRISRPQFTYEFAKDLTTRLYLEVNRITARTSYQEPRLKSYLNLQSHSMADWFATVGIHKIISEKAWQEIQKMSEVDPSTVIENDNGEFTGFNYWKSLHGITWNENLPVSDEMLKIVKAKNNLDGERFGQDTILHNLFWSVRIFLEGGLNRSLDGLTLDHEKMIHKESVVMSPQNSKGGNESFIDKTKNGLMNMFMVKR